MNTYKVTYLDGHTSETITADGYFADSPTASVRFFKKSDDLTMEDSAFVTNVRSVVSDG